MKLEVEIIKGLPIEQINEFEDKTTYNVAVETREFAKGSKAFPYLTGELERAEVAEPIIGGNKEYSLAAGVDYAVNVYKLDRANWTNPSTQPQWYHSVFAKNKEIILMQAVSRALKELNNE